MLKLLYTSLFTLLFVLFISKITFGQTSYTALSDSITNIQNTSNPYIYFEWGDYDNDNDLDFMIIKKYTYCMGNRFRIYRNEGNDTFSIDSNCLFPGFTYCKWGDYDNDGDLDILTRDSMSGYLSIYMNTLPDSIGFVKKNDSCSGYVSNGMQSFDINNSGKLNSNNAYTYNSVSSNEFTTLSCFTLNIYPIYTDTTPLNNSFNNTQGLFNEHINTTEYGDINKDGYIDIVNARLNNLLINEGTDSNYKFRSLNFNTVPTGIEQFVSKVGDIDCDGYIDNGVSCYYQNGNKTFNLYKNNHNSTFTNVPNTGLPTNIYSKQYYFDHNNNGYLDLLLSKSNGDNTLYYNVGSFYFFENSSITNLNDNFYEAAAADYDNDGDLDLLLSGNGPTYLVPGYTVLYRNDSTPPNTPPTPPTGLYAEMDSTKLILRWQRATDVETPQATLSYNLMVGTSPKGIDITSPMADTVTGFRRVVELGNAQLNDFYILDKSILNIGDTLYWSVQTIDNGFGYSPFSQQCTTIICNSLKPQFDTICNNDSLLWQGNYYNTTGDYYQIYGSGASCDSSFNLFLKADSAYLNLQQTNICNGSGGYQWQGNTYYSSGTYNIYNTTTQGCDSIERLILGVHHNFTNLQNQHICMGDSLAFGSNYLKSPGVYNDSLLSAFGCDSLVQLSLDISPEDTLVIQLGDSLIAQSTTALFRWWDCNAQNYIYAANNAVFVPYQNGSYAVEITEHGCSYLTGCFEVSGLNIYSPSSSQALESIKLQPNPATDWLSIVSSKSISITEINLFSIQGNLLISKSNISNTKPIKLNISTLPQGVYLLQFTTEYGMEYRRLIKE